MRELECRENPRLCARTQTGTFAAMSRLALPIILLFALVLRVAYLLEQQATSPLFFQFLLDEQEMVTTARQLLATGSFGPEPFFKAPLYPMILAGVMAVFGDAWPFMMRLLQHLLGVGLVALGFTLARTLAGPGHRGLLAAIAAGLLLAFNGPLIRQEHQILLDFPAMAAGCGFLATLLWFLAAPTRAARRRWLLLAGVAAAVAWLLRPSMTIVLPAMAIVILLMRQSRPRLASAALLLAPLGITVALFAGRNFLASGEPLLLPWQGGFSLYESNRVGATGRYFLQSEFASSETGNPAYRLAIDGYRKSANIPPDAPISFGAVDKFWSGRARAEILTDPVRWIGLMLQKALYLTSRTEIYNIEVYEVQRSESSILPLTPVDFGILWPLATASLALIPTLTPGRRRAFFIVWGFSIFSAISVALYLASGRLRMPLVFPAAVLGAAGLSLALTAPALHRATYAALFCVGLVMSWGDWFGVRSQSFAHVDYGRLSNAAWRAGQAERALGYADRVAELAPEYPTIPLLRGMAQYSLGQFGAAHANFVLAQSTLTTDATPALNAGMIAFYEWKDPASAALQFTEALRRNPRLERAAAMRDLCALWQGEAVAPVGEARSIEGHILRLLLSERGTPSAPLRTTFAERFGSSGINLLGEIDALLKLPPQPRTAFP